MFKQIEFAALNTLKKMKHMPSCFPLLACSAKHSDLRQGVTHTSVPPMQKRTTRRSRNQDDISLYRTIKKHEAITTNKTADVILMFTAPLALEPLSFRISSEAS